MNSKYYFKCVKPDEIDTNGLIFCDRKSIKDNSIDELFGVGHYKQEDFKKIMMKIYEIEGITFYAKFTGPFLRIIYSG